MSDPRSVLGAAADAHRAIGEALLEHGDELRISTLWNGLMSEFLEFRVGDDVIERVPGNRRLAGLRALLRAEAHTLWLTLAP